VPLESEVQSTSLFTCTLSSQRVCPEGSL